MKLRLVRHLWGIDTSAGFASLVDRWHEQGFEILEVSLRRVANPVDFREVVRTEGFDWIPQVFTNMFVPGGTVEEHLHSLREQVEECIELQPLLINAHSGSDAWTPAQAEEFYGRASELERTFGVSISHETHRSRYFGNPWNTKHILDRFPQLQLTCDFSHWVCIAERLLPDCTEILRQAAEHCLHLHARVGYEQGPQVPDPRAPAWSHHLRTHEEWWEMIWQAQRARQFPSSTLTPEFGPPPYMHTMPYTEMPVANLEDICLWMARRQAERFLQIGNRSETKD